MPIASLIEVSKKWTLRIDFSPLPRFYSVIKATTPRLKRWRHGTRRTLAKQIRQLAQTDALAASLLAERGKQFSEIETLLYLYYETLEQFRKIKAGQKTTDEKLLATATGCVGLAPGLQYYADFYLV